MMNDGTVIRDGHESHVGRGQGLPSPQPSAKSASVRSRPGILIFSRRQQLLHMNRRALEPSAHLTQTEIRPVNDILLAPVRGLNAQIQEALDSHKEANIWKLFELKRVIFETERKILVRGFGLAERNSHDDSRIVIILKEVGLRQEHELRRRRRGSSLLRAIPPSPRSPYDGDPKEAISDARESPSLDRKQGVRISERGLQ